LTIPFFLRLKAGGKTVINIGILVSIPWLYPHEVGKGSGRSKSVASQHSLCRLPPQGCKLLAGLLGHYTA